MTLLQEDIAAEIQSLSPSAEIVLWEVDLSIIGGDGIHRFHGGTNKLRQSIVWQGNVYTPWAVDASGFDFSGTGQLPRPKLSLSNVRSSISALVIATQDCVGAKVTRKVTHARFLDAVNFPDGLNPTANPDAHYPDEIYFVDRKGGENKNRVEFELTCGFDVTGTKLPRRQIIQNLCPWRYRGAECGYTGENYFMADDTPTDNAVLDVCGKRVSSCKCRFGEYSELNYGGFPAAGVIQG